MRLSVDEAFRRYGDRVFSAAFAVCHSREDAVRSGAKSYEQVQQMLKFGTGCGKCVEFIRYFVNELLQEAERGS